MLKKHLWWSSHGEGRFLMSRLKNADVALKSCVCVCVSYLENVSLCSNQQWIPVIYCHTSSDLLFCRSNANQGVRVDPKQRVFKVNKNSSGDNEHGLFHYITVEVPSWIGRCHCPLLVTSLKKN
ncbi:hypothetical protein ATANTOWER_026437 [Ataeniobius toweri]|uniref:Uncharacterized protein n=1 Tax=Ataeniobius toweri TaxID=208326 RepID=A0ABU7CJ74_9TELE|nr:hypothetical protein [Ataeniobius toweri]